MQGVATINLWPYALKLPYNYANFSHGINVRFPRFTSHPPPHLDFSRSATVFAPPRAQLFLAMRATLLRTRRTMKTGD